MTCLISNKYYANISKGDARKALLLSNRKGAQISTMLLKEECTMLLA